MNLNENIKLIPVTYNPFTLGEIEKISTLIEPQQEVWLSCLLGGDDASRAYNESISIHFTGTLDVVALNSAMDKVIQRHEALRCSFSKDGKSIFIYKRGKTDFIVKDIRSNTPDIQKEIMDEYLKKNAEAPFNMETGPLVRTTLFKLSDTEHLFTFTAHHIVCDGWSLGTIFEDLSRFYSATVQGIPTPSVEWTNMSAYANEVLKFAKSEGYIQTEQYWLNKYQNSIPQLSMPFDYPRPKMRTYKSKRDDYPIDKAFVARIREMGAKVGSSFVTTLLTAYEIFIHKLTGQDDIVVGLPAAGQSAMGHFSLVGHCVNMLPIRSRIKGNYSFIDHLKRRKSEVLDDLEHQQLSFGTLIKKLGIKRDPSQVPLVPLVFNIDMGMNANVSFHGLQHRLISNPRTFETFDIFLNASGSEDALMLEWSYNTQLFKAETIASMMQQFTDLLDTVIADPDVKLMDISLGGDTITIGTTPSVSEMAYPKDKPFTAYISEVAANTPDKTAIRFNDDTINYGKLEQSSNRLANYLMAKGVAKGDIIGVAMDRSINMVVTLLGVAKSGAAYIPLDPQYPANRVEFMLGDSGAKFLLTEAKHQGVFSSQATELLYDEVAAEIGSYPSSPPQQPIRGEDIVYVLYTSGSTGKPKGVQISHANLANLLLSMLQEPGMAADDTLLALTTISFDIAGLELYLPLLSGASMVLADSDTRLDSQRILDIVKLQGVTLLQATPATWRMMLESGWNHRLPIKALCGGEAFPADLAEKLLDRCEEVWNVYGPTETTIYSTLKQVKRDELPITIGKPIANTEVYILNETLTPVKNGLEGEIYIGGDGVALGYLNRPDLTAERFLSNPFSDNPEAKIYRTGDLGKILPNGEIQCLGRMDTQVKIRGFRIELGEIEYHLNRQEGIKESVVVAREDTPGDQRLVAYLLPANQRIAKRTSENGIPADKESARIWKQGLLASLPSYMIPNDWILLPKFPLTPNKKIDRKALPAPHRSILTLEKDGSESSLSPNEQIVFDIWASIFKTTDIGKDDDFFEIGGHSILAIEVITRVNKKTGVKLPLATLFKQPTIRQLASSLTKETDIQWGSLVPIKTQGTKPPLYIVHGAGMNVLAFQSFTQYVDQEQPVYGLQAKGLNGIDKPHTTIEEMATDYIKEIIQQNPNGPYALSGYSSGGVIAFEMARQLKRMNREVVFLGLLDTDSNVHHYKNLFKRRKFLSMITYTGQHIRYAGIYLFKYRSKYIKHNVNFIFGSLYNMYARWKNKRFKSDPSENNEEEDFNKLIYKIKLAHGRAFTRYQHQPYDGKAVLFKGVTASMNYRHESETYGWRPLFKEGLTVRTTSFEHQAYFSLPNSEELARLLQEEVNKALKEQNRELLHLSV